MDSGRWRAGRGVAADGARGSRAGIGRLVARAATLRTVVLRMLLLQAACLLALIAAVGAGLEQAEVNGGWLAHLRSESQYCTSLRLAMQEQRSELSDYLSSHNTRLLDEYGDGRREADDALSGLRRETAGTPAASAVVGIEAAARSWQDWAEARRAQGRALTAADSAEGVDRFHEFESRVEGLQAELDRQTATSMSRTTGGLAFAVAALLGGALVVGIVMLRLAGRIHLYALNPMLSLVATATQIAVQGRARIPFADRPDEIGDLARALSVLQDASAEREILAEGAPIGICRVDLSGRVVAANLALLSMLGASREEVVGRPWDEFIFPGDRGREQAAFAAATEAEADRHEFESRHVRTDGSVIWCAVIMAPVRGTDGRTEGFIVIQEDISARKREAERAAQIQRQLLPQAAPVIPGWELAGACLPAQAVAGDLYDWVAHGEDWLELTVADVMGKGVPAALVMAVLRTALRSAAPGLGPVERVRLASRSVSLGTGDEGLFVTLFHAQLDISSGVLRYVDAGHGYCTIRRLGGELERLTMRALPIGVADEGSFVEGHARIGPGDTLVVYSDGLVEREERSLDLDELLRDCGRTDSAGELVRRLMASVPASPADDVTLVALRRVPLTPGPPCRGDEPAARSHVDGAKAPTGSVARRRAGAP